MLFITLCCNVKKKNKALRFLQLTPTNEWIELKNNNNKNNNNLSNINSITICS